MKKYSIEVLEVLSRIVEVDALYKEDAIEQVTRKIPDIVKAESIQPECFAFHEDIEDRLPFLD